MKIKMELLKRYIWAYIDGRIEDLEGITVEVIANVRYDEYNEVRKLNPRKILQKYYVSSYLF